jgi:hypothetical protein
MSQALTSMSKAQLIALLEAPTAPAPKAQGTAIIKSTRKAAVAALPTAALRTAWAHVSTLDLCIAITSGEIPCPKGFRVGTRNAERAADWTL